MPSQSDTIQKSASVIKRSSVLIKALSLSLVALIALSSIAYAVSYFYDKFSSFSVSVNKYDMANQGLTLSETSDFNSPTARLSADAVNEITNISGNDLPENIDSINGQHNGSNYIAYTFYLKNMGSDTLSYEYSVTLSNVTMSIDEAIRIRLYVDGVPTDYAKTKSDGTGAEENTVEFPTLSIAAKERVENFAPDASTRFTIVIWLEGDDPDCTDAIVGGRMKADMKISIAENS